MIVVVDYDVGNVKSVCNAFNYIGCEAKLSKEPDVLAAADALVLPGVAAFGYAIEALGELAATVQNLAKQGKPLLGICVGYQMLFERSYEYGSHEGLGLIGGEVVPIPESPERSVPHMGWNVVQNQEEIDLFEGLEREKHFYFGISYYAKVEDLQTSVAYTEYGFDLPAAVQKQNVFGTQFHPEKSGPQGLEILKNFAKIAKKRSC